MIPPALLLTALAAAGAAPQAPAPRPPENLLAGPARCVLRYLDAVRRAGPIAPLQGPAPRGKGGPGTSPLQGPAPRGKGGPGTSREGTRAAPDPKAYAEARRLTAPRTLAEIDRLAARGQDHPLAPWREAARDRVLESFQLLGARRAPLGAAVVTVRERHGRGPASPERSVAEYLVARVDGEWKVVDRRPGGTFEDAAVERGYAGFFDAPATTR